jgi:hypothetical protein
MNHLHHVKLSNINPTTESEYCTEEKKEHPSTKSIHPTGHIRLFLSKITEQMANEAF